VIDLVLTINNQRRIAFWGMVLTTSLPRIDVWLGNEVSATSLAFRIVSFQEDCMKYVGIDLHTNRFTCCYLFDNSQENRRKPLTLIMKG